MPPPPGSASFIKDLEILEALAARPVVGAADLGRMLNDIYVRAANAQFGDYDVEDVREAALELIYRLFDMRVGLRNRIPAFERDGLMVPAVVDGLRNVFRILRYVTDMVGEVGLNNARVPDGEKPLTGFRGRHHNTLVNYAFAGKGDLTFQSGDVILVRGQAHNSAAIARIGTADSQFSHIGVVHIDGVGRHWMVESLIEDGAIINRLTDSLEHGIVRAVLYRHKNAALAAEAAKAIHEHVASSRTGRGRRILYDFTMRLDDHRQLFCAKLVRLAFQKASEGKIALPSYPTAIVQKNRDFIDRIGVLTDTTFAPADIDLESDFDLVAEWQDYRETSNIRLQDFTMDKLFEWMETYNYRFQETFAVRLVAWLGRFSAYFSDGAKQMLSSLFPRVPINMRRRTVATVAMLHKTAEPLYHALQEQEKACVAATGRPMHGNDIFASLEDVRAREGSRIGYLVRGR